MKSPLPGPIQLSVRDQQDLAIPAILAGIVINLLLLVYAFFFDLTPIEQRVNYYLGIGGLCYIVLTYYLLLPVYREIRPLIWLAAITNGLAITTVLALESYSVTGLAFLFSITILVASPILFGRLPSYLYTLIVTGAQILIGRPLLLGLSDGPIAYLIFPFLAPVVTETVILTHQTILRQVNHLKILNEVARSLATSLDMPEVVEMVSSAIRSALQADTYYFGLLTKEGVRTELFYDDGEYFPATVLPLENTLAGHVIRTRDTLWVNDMSREREKLNLPVFIVGKPRLSTSWIGTPMEAGGELIGIMAVASYQRNAFTQSDYNLLKSLANQAAMAIDNARHHQQVERRSQIDSLTGCLNHGAFLLALQEKFTECAEKGVPLSLIMLDIDHFKLYNDQHGHLIGDQVLCLLTDTITRNIKSGDLVGRWGGEEFAIALPDATGEEAIQVARRLQKSIGQICLANRESQILLAPTISQGIALFPTDSTDIYGLVDLADQRLYRAKERGRNQVEPNENFWQNSLMLQPQQEQANN